MNLESVVERIPNSLHGDLSNKLVDIVLGSRDKDAVPTELAKRIIYLWRQDQLASPLGIVSLLDAAVMVDSNATYSTLEQLGLQEITAAVKNLNRNV